MAYLHEALPDFRSQNSFEGIVLHADHVDGCELSLCNSNDDFHADEGAANYDELLSLLCSYIVRAMSGQYRRFSQQ